MYRKIELNVEEAEKLLLKALNINADHPHVDFEWGILDNVVCGVDIRYIESLD